ncbi:MAG TPA: hypothetical protein VFR58_18380 [Flavisolibacter sp.]|nr:hypothetical protein [Flavisolibacter sp.]
MQKRNDNNGTQPAGRHEHKLPHEIDQTAKEQAAAAHEQADRDMDDDAELSAHSPNDDLDEGETARLGEDRNDLI